MNSYSSLHEAPLNKNLKSVTNCTSGFVILRATPISFWHNLWTCINIPTSIIRDMKVMIHILWKKYYSLYYHCCFFKPYILTPIGPEPWIETGLGKRKKPNSRTQMAINNIAKRRRKPYTKKGSQYPPPPTIYELNLKQKHNPWRQLSQKKVIL